MSKKQSRMKITAILIIAVMAAAIFASCASGEDEQVTTTAAGSGDTADTGSEVVEEVKEEPKILPDLDPEADFGGYVFRIATNGSNWDNGDWRDWIPRDIYAEEETGDPINDAVYRRNAYLEELYNFKVEQVQTSNISGDIRKAVGAGDATFDAAETGLRDTPAIAQTGNLVNLFNVPNLDLDQPWWDQGAVKNLSIANRLFFTNGDIVLVARDACPGILFNKKLLAELQLEDPYALVRANKWTIAKFNELAKGGSADLNGNGILDYTEYQTDRFGFISQRDAQIAVFHGAGGRIATKDDKDYPVIIFDSERSYSAMEGCYDIMYDYTVTINMHHVGDNLPGNIQIYPVSEQMFQEDRGLFMWVRLRIVQNLRGMETDFGILPMPKLDENQLEWGHTVNSFTGQTLSVVNVHDDDGLARTGHILEALAAESKYTVIPAYYDTQLKTKIARDDDSSEMLDLIFSTTVWDVGEVYNWGNLSSDLIYMSMTSNRNIASTFEKAEPRMLTQIEKVIEKYEELD